VNEKKEGYGHDIENRSARAGHPDYQPHLSTPGGVYPDGIQELRPFSHKNGTYRALLGTASND
jgi:hypothetical protein